MAQNHPDGLTLSSRSAADDDAAMRITAQRAGESGFFFDFDGTLAQIQDDPEAVRLVPGASEALAELVRVVRKVVIVSARPVRFLREHLSDLPEVTLFGLYGLESQIGLGPVETHPEAEPFEPVMVGLAQRATADLPAGVLVEYKRLSVALHYRAVPRHRGAVETWANQHAERLGLRAQPGRMVVELKPPGTRDKGSVVTEQLRGLSCAWYFGDDLSDLRAFAALDERVAADPDFLGLRVSVANAESGHALRPAADICLDDPDQVPPFLTTLVEAITSS
jgi:trehalose 6-phosphate phosphatase